MKKAGAINKFPAYLLNKTVATKYATAFAKLSNLIPLVDYTGEEILAEAKEERIFYGKWKHSLAVFDKNQPIALIIAYERKAENKKHYPENSLYISEIAVAKEYQKQGIAKKLIKLFLNLNQKLLCLNGKLIYNTQTNSAEWNKPVQALYMSFGFEPRTTKKYNNRTDVILTLIPN